MAISPGVPRNIKYRTGLSGDPKPTGQDAFGVQIEEGDIFTETDTQNDYEFKGGVWVFTDAADGVTNILEDSIVTALSGGQHTPIAVTANATYEVDSDVDIRVKNSGTPANYQHNLDEGEFLRGPGSDFSGIAAWDFGATDITLETWTVIDDELAANADHILFDIGNTGGPRLGIRIGVNASNQLTMDMEGETDDGTNLFSAGATVDTGALTAYEAGPSLIRQFVAVLDRGNDKIEWYIDAVKVAETVSAFVDADTWDLTTLSGTDGKFSVGEKINSAGNMDGKTLAVHMYDSALTLTQIQTRNGLGPGVLTTDGINPVLVINIAAQSSWVDAGKPEVTDAAGNVLLTFSTVDQTSRISALASDAIASTSNSKRIRAGQAEFIKVSGDYLNVYSAPAAAGDVILTKVG